jgi:epoxyqueuosine reductase
MTKETDLKIFLTSELEDIRKKSKESGFLDVQFLPAVDPDDSFQNEYKKYLARDFHGEMKYLENLEVKFHIHSIYEKAQTIAVFSLPYLDKDFKQETLKHPYLVSAYAAGEDYHGVVKEKLHAIIQDHGQSRIVCDTTPLPERYYGYLGGLGFSGKNSMLIHPLYGSYFFLAIVLFEKKLPDISNIMETHTAINRRSVEKNMLNYCKDCNKCIVACPGGALDGSGYLDSRKCYSYWSIENRSAQINHKFKKISFIFGCDICQTVCPYNTQSVFTNLPEFKITETAKKIMNGDLNNFKKSDLKGTSFYRSGLEGLERNINYVKDKNNQVRSR